MQERVHVCVHIASVHGTRLHCCAGHRAGSTAECPRARVGQLRVNKRARIAMHTTQRSADLCMRVYTHLRAHKSFMCARASTRSHARANTCSARAGLHCTCTHVQCVRWSHMHVCAGATLHAACRADAL